MWNTMSASHPSVFTSNVSEGVNRVRTSKGKYAFLLESIYNDFHNNRKPCNTMMIGPKLNNQGLGIAVHKKNKTLGNKVTMAILKLQESGELIKMYTKWFIEKGECGGGEAVQESKRKSLPLSKLVGVFYILIVILMIAIITVVVEHLLESKKAYRKVEKFPTIETDQEGEQEPVVCNGRNNIR